MIELGVGFHPELSGRENVYLSASVYGLTKADVDRIYDAVVDYSEIRAFIDEPIKNYSSGMMMRLAFALAITSTPRCCCWTRSSRWATRPFSRSAGRRCATSSHRGEHSSLSPTRQAWSRRCATGCACSATGRKCSTVTWRRGWRVQADWRPLNSLILSGAAPVSRTPCPHQEPRVADARRARRGTRRARTGKATDTTEASACRTSSGIRRP